MNQQNLFSVANDDNNIMSFTMRKAHRMWPSDEHRERCIRQVGRFVDFRDYGAKPISHFLPRDIHEFADQLAADGSSPATVNRYLAAISKVFNHAVDNQLINQAPKLKFNREDNHRIRYFSIEEQDKLISYFEHIDMQWMREFVVLSLKTGVRKGEIVALCDGKVAVSEDGQWLLLSADVTKTRKAAMCRSMIWRVRPHCVCKALASTAGAGSRWPGLWQSVKSLAATLTLYSTSARIQQQRRWSMTCQCRQ